MSSEVRGEKKIIHTKGDSGLFRVRIDIKDSEGKVIDNYQPTEGDTVRFALKKHYCDPKPLIMKEIPSDTLLLKLEPEDTKGLCVGEYVYDIELTFSDGFVDTFIKEAPFILRPEVH